MGNHRNNRVPQNGQAGAATARAQQLYTEGISFHRAGRLGEAAAAYEQVLRLVPKHFGALHHIGILAFEGGNYELAAGFIRSALAVNPNVAAAYSDLGNALKEQAQFDQALENYDKAIALNPGDANAHYNRGVALYATKRFDAAVASFDRALALNPDDAQAYNNRGAALKELQRYQDALDSYDRALALQPDFAEAYNNRGNVRRALGEFVAALECFDTAIALAPMMADGHCNRGITLQVLGRTAEALDSYDRALRLSPDFAEAYHNRANALYDLKRWEPALADSHKAVTLRPNYAEAYARLGETLQEMKEYAGAVKSYDLAIRLGFASAELHERKSAALRELKQYEAALASADQSVRIKDQSTGHAARGNVLLDLNRLEEALQSFERAIELAPGKVEPHNSRGVALGQLGRDGEALASYGQAVSLDPEYGFARLNRAILNLRIGNLAEGWPEYEWRWKVGAGKQEKDSRNFAQPLWLGAEPLEGKTILLYAEQGLGDTIQFCRYAPLVALRGARVILEVQPALVRLLRDLPGVAAIVARGGPLPDFDYCCPLMSLPLAFQTSLNTIPAPHLAAEPDHVAGWAARLGERSKPRIGLAWSGSTIHRGDHHRSIALADFAQLLSDEFEFISLQKEVRPADQAVLDSMPQVRQFGPQLGDMADTAALCELIDVVVCVDTSIAHLAGSLGKPVWVLLPAIADWRWLRERTDSPWYPSMRLYRQPVPGQWAPALAAVKADLAKLQG